MTLNNKKIFINSAQEIVPLVNDSPYKRILAIGDVHAAYDKLQSLWKKLSVNDDDLVIFLGDYLYGMGDGDKNINTLHWLIEHRNQKNIIFLRGNVDETYRHCLFDVNGNFFCKLNSRVARAIKTTSLKEPNFPQEIYDFLTGLALYHSITIGGRKYFFCHAGINIDAPLNAQPKSYLLNHPKLKNFYRDYTGESVIVVGHKSPKKIFGNSEKYNPNLPLKVPGRNILMLDTHAKAENGPLSCVDLLSGEFWQSDTAQIDSILFVCSGNTCRSPMAKYIMRHLLKQNDLSEKFFIDSAGCNTRGGSFMSRRAREVLREKNIPFDKHISKRFTVQEYRKFKCIIALDEDMLLQAKEISGGDPDNKIRLFTDFDGRKIIVNDPFHADNPREAYLRAYEQIYLGCSSLIKQLNNRIFAWEHVDAI